MSLFIKTFNGVLRCKPVTDLGRSGGDLRRNIGEVEGIRSDEILLTCNGRLVNDDDTLETNHVYHAGLRIKGGKGGFGSMLRMLGAQIEKTTNHEACRDLSGRRMRDVNNEKKLAEWVKKNANAEAEKEQRRRERLERMARDPKHVFKDPAYDEQRANVSESLAEAVEKGMEASASTSASSSSTGGAVKRKMDINESSTSTKKRSFWMGVEDDSDSDEDSDEDESEKSMEQEGTNERLQDTEASGESTETKDAVIPPSEEASTTQTEESKSQIDEPVDLEQYSTSEELAALGLERLKAALMTRGLKCGGTLQERAVRLLSVKGLSPDQIDSSLKAKPVKAKKKGKKL